MEQIFNYYYSGYQKIVDLLIESGADVNAKNKYNETALISAAWKGNFQIENSTTNQNL